MVDPKTGEVFNNVPDAEVQRATDQFGLVSAEHYAMLQRYGGIADQAAAAGKTAANVATFGLAGFDSTEDKRQIQAFQEQSPTLAALSEIAGAAAPGALGGGAAGLVMRGLGASARAAQIGGVVAEEVAQSAAIEAEHAREESRGIELGNVVMGLPLALGVSAAGRLARGAARRVRGSLDSVPRSTLDAAEDPGNALAQGRRTSEARRSVGAAGSGPDRRPPLTEDEVRSYARNRDEIHAQVERFGGDAIEDAAAGTAPAFDEVHNISLKKSDLAGKMNDADPDAVLDFADQHIRAVDDLANRLEAGGQKGAARQLRAHVDEITRSYTVEDPSDLFIASDRTKRTLDRLRTRYGAAARRDINAERVVDDIDAVVEPLRSDLEDLTTWGKFAAEKQAGENALWSGDEGIIRSGAVWQHEFLERLPGAAGRMRRGLQEVPVFKVRGDVVAHALAMKPRDFELTMNAMSSWIDKVEAMSLLKTELGAQSVGTTPIMRLQQGLADMRTLRDELITLREAEKRGSAVIAKEAAKDSARGTAEILFEAAEEIPGVGGPLKGGRRLVEKATGRPLFEPPVAPPLPEYTREGAGAIIRARRQGLGRGGRTPDIPPKSGLPPVSGAPSSQARAQASFMHKPGDVASGLEPVTTRAVGGPTTPVVDQPLASADAAGTVAPAAKVKESAKGWVPGQPEPISVFRRHAGRIPGPDEPVNPLFERIGPQLGNTPGGKFRGSDGQTYWVKVSDKPAQAAIEAGNQAMYRALGRDALNIRAMPLGGGQIASVSLDMGPDWVDLDRIPDWSKLPKDVQVDYARSIPADIVLGNWDSGRNAGNTMVHLPTGRTLMIDGGEAGINAEMAGWFRAQGQEGSLQKELRRLPGPHLRERLKASVTSEKEEAWVGMSRGIAPPGEVIDRLSQEEVRVLMQDGISRIEASATEAGGFEPLLRKHQPTMTPEQITTEAAHMRRRLQALKLALPTLAVALAVSFGGTEAFAATPVTDSLAEIADNNRVIQERAALGLVSKESRPPKLPPLAERFKEGAKDIGQAFQNKIEDLKQVNEDPQAFVGGMVDTFGPIADGGHEDLYAKVVARVQIGVQYLLANAPPSVGISMARPDGIPPDSLAVMKWAAMWDGVFNPGSVVYDVATGDATPTQIRALREVHPDIYGSLRAEVLKQVGQAGQKIPFETLRGLDNLFDLPGVAGPSFSPGMTSTMAQAYAAGQKVPQQSLGGESVLAAPASATTKFSGLAGLA
jgi:hypothetical protein